MGANVKFKDSVFTLLFRDENTLRELYGALTGTKIPKKTPVKINTLVDILYIALLNDVSFVVGDRVVVLIEHQSTINPNMAIRLLMYIGRVYEEITAEMNLFGREKLSIPWPEFIILYNGSAPYPDKAVLKLSDLFKNAASLGIPKDRLPPLELTAVVYNINQGRNEDIVKRCRMLKEYSDFIAKAREFGAEKAGKRGAVKTGREEREKALKKAIEWSIDHNILKDFLTRYGSEVVNMLMKEWTVEDFIKYQTDEERKIGRQKGRQEGRKERDAEIVKNALAKGLPVTTISEITGLSTKTIRSLGTK